jgi:glycerol-3-phosphate dehydrogenase
LLRNTRALQEGTYDVIVIGGGFFGAFTAWDAALRGLSVCLVDKGDFCGATSANSFKIVHGGIRYLQHLDLTRVLRSSGERSAFLRIAPHLVRPMPVLIPTYGHGKKGKPLLRLGLSVYDALTWNRNRGIRSPLRRIPRARAFSASEALASFPGLESHGLTGGLLFHDAQMYNPARLALSALRSAAERGAHLANRVEVTGFLVEGDRVRGVLGWDRLDDRSLEIRGSVVINAAGPWAGRLLERTLNLQLSRPQPTFSRDVALVVRRCLDGDVGLALTAGTRDAEALLDRGGRHLFLIPWRDYTLAGVWHRRFDGSPEEIDLAPGEVDGFLDEVNRAFPGADLQTEDVLSIHTGLILYNDDQDDGEGHRFGRRSLIVDHGREDRIDGLITVIGVRATMARHVAERGVDLALRKLGRRSVACSTAHSTLFGGDFEDFEELVNEMPRREGWPDGSPIRRSMAHSYGSRYSDVISIAEEEPRLALPIGGSTVLAAEVIHAARHEMAVGLDDVIFRRTDLGVGHQPSPADIELCAELMAAELGWDGAKVRDETRGVQEMIKVRGTFRSPPRTIRRGGDTG